ncbi:uncharacterized protein C8Q71DRAFT_738182 [Rhodofomes roseus]|uniref:Uncharacterized protein n=1 Tax=Rhodofomes roseus TaxID=34475 RepID=A0ABQ8KS80_9APHY|nr:uncharacterized protein C8Q71DRAFT_738182 [Rhodofomes roseus]KAH9841671.1 hypothetical protein C8Q71DRAFT_738182 [Rhodofomes roseus]
MKVLLQYSTRAELDPVQIQRDCMLIGSEFRMCPVDIATFAAVGFLIFLILRGIPMTVAFVKWCKSKRSKQTPRRLSLYASDVENSPKVEEPDSPAEDAKYDRDPYLSPTERLFTFLRSDSALPHPMPAVSPRHRCSIALAPTEEAVTGSPSDPMFNVGQVADGFVKPQSTSFQAAIAGEAVLRSPPPVYSSPNSGGRALLQQ